ncbi:MAG TPA: MFS transporter [Trebonia sp.]|jgi:putative MFS transporter
MSQGEQTTATTDTAIRAALNARLDRLPRWGLGWGVLAIFGICYMLSFYDISVAGIALPTIVDRLHLSSGQQELAITTNLLGYTVGSLILSMVADRLGRRPALLGCVLLLAVGAACTAISWNAASFAVFRGITGLGIGAQITLSSTFVGELAPPSKRGRYLAVSIIFGACGNIIPAVLAVPLLASGDIGWRVLFALPALIFLILLCFNDRVLPESPRWLATHGRIQRADKIVASMENRLTAKIGPLPEPAAGVPEDIGATSGFSAREIFTRALLPRLVLMIAFWFCWYIVEDGFLSFQTTIINDLGIHLTDAQVVTAIGFAGGTLGAVIQAVAGDKLERKHLAAIGLTVFTLSFVLLAAAPNPAVSAIASFGVNTGTFLTIIPAYTYTAESFPTRARASAMGIGDGLGHVAGGIQPYIFIPLLSIIGPRNVLWTLTGIAIVPLLIILFGRKTTGRPLSEITQ